jgi:predicted signal transduction protein with EAL and GGDEF domain
MRQADIAMYAAKRTNQGIVVWDEKYNRHGLERLSLMSDLRKAVEGNELSLVYQPTVALSGGPAHYVEALVRWRHPKRGVVSPVDFPFPGGTDRLHPRDHAMGAGRGHCNATWRAEGLQISVSINLSARDDGHHVARPRGRSAASARLRGAVIALEITESAISTTPDMRSRTCTAERARLQAVGRRLWHRLPSLAYLRRLPLNELRSTSRSSWAWCATPATA